MAVTASRVVDFGATVSVDSLQLIQDSRDEDDDLPVMYLPQDILFTALTQPGVYGIPFQVLLRYGYSNLRLYKPRDLAVTIEALRAPTKPEPDYNSGGIAFTVGLNTIVFIQPSGFAGQQVVSLGRRKELQQETLTFNGSFEQSVQFPYDDPNMTILNRSRFINSSGATIDAPKKTRSGTFGTSQEAYGAMLVEYEAEYEYFRVFYDLPKPERKYEAFTGSTQQAFTVYVPPAPPDLPVVARSDLGVTFIQMERKLHSWDFGPPRNQDENEGNLAFDGTEFEREDVDTQVPITDEPFVIVERPTVIKFRDVNNQNRVFTLRLQA